MQYIVFIVGDWGYTKGGINVFNRSVCEVIGKEVKNGCQQIICMAQDIEEEIITKDSKTYNLQLISYTSKDYEKPKSLISILKRNVAGIDSPQNQVVWVGHDIKTGPIAYKCKSEFGNNSKFAVIHHMAYAQYYMYVNRDSEEYLKKKNEQEETLTKADIIFANGPKLAKTAKDVIGDRTIQVVELKPGLSEVQPIKTIQNDFSVITFGRIESAEGTKRNNSIIKQIYLAGCAWGHFYTKVKPNEYESRLEVYGFDTNQDNGEKERFISKIGEAAGNIAVPVVCAPYEEDREKFLKNIAKNSLCLFLSLSEGFGLAGLEAISAGVPLILSKSSGLYQALENDKLENYVTAVEIRGNMEEPYYFEQDFENVTKSIKEVFSRQERKKQDALDLIDLMRRKKYTWNDCANTILGSLFELSDGNAEENVPESCHQNDNENRDYSKEISLFQRSEKINNEKVIQKLGLVKNYPNPRYEAERIIEIWENEGWIRYKENGDYFQI